MRDYEQPSEATSDRMRRVKSKDTALERAMEEILKALNVIYEKHPDLCGHPDFRITGTDVLLFCDSSFWHGRREKELTGEAFKKNKEYWMHKIIENKKRDRRVNRILRQEGWSVHRFWDTDIYKHPDKIIKRLRRITGGEHKRHINGD